MLQKAYAVSGPIVVALILGGVAHLRADPAPPRLTARRITVQGATPATFGTLDGAGRTLLRQIATVGRHLPLDRPATLRWVPGIGTSRLDRWWPWLADCDGRAPREHVAWRR